MGSSFGAGPGVRPRADGAPPRSGRSAVNYAHLVARARSLDLVDVTFSGETIAGMRVGSPNSPAQVGAADSATELITITAGGNDVGYLGTLTFAGLPRLLRGLRPVNRQLRESLKPGELDRRFGVLDTEFRGLLADLRRRSPDARILIVGYLTILPPGPQPTTGLPDRAAVWARDVAARLGTLMADVAAGGGAEFVDVGAASVDHQAWSADPWTNRFTLRPGSPAPYHPTAAGMRAVAAMVGARLDETP